MATRWTLLPRPRPGSTAHLSCAPMRAPYRRSRESPKRYGHEGGCGGGPISHVQCRAPTNRAAAVKGWGDKTAIYRTRQIELARDTIAGSTAVRGQSARLCGKYTETPQIIHHDDSFVDPDRTNISSIYLSMAVRARRASIRRGISLVETGNGGNAHLTWEPRDILIVFGK